MISDFCGGGVGQDCGHGAHGEKDQHSTLQCDIPVCNPSHGCTIMHQPNQRPKDIGLLQIKSPRLSQWD